MFKKFLIFIIVAVCGLFLFQQPIVSTNHSHTTVDHPQPVA